MNISFSKIALFLVVAILFNACKSTSNDPDPKDNASGNVFEATVDGKVWKAKEVSGSVAVVGGLLTIVGKVDALNNISVQMVGRDIKIGTDYQFIIPSNEANKNANIVYVNAGKVMPGNSGKVRFSTFSATKIEGTFEAGFNDFINTTASATQGKFTINL
jgi:hypothetical protein